MPNDQILGEIKQAIGAHGAWKLKLRRAISAGSAEADPSAVRRDNLCSFGKWLYGPTIGLSTKNGSPYQVTKRIHAEFHQCASEVLDLALRGKKAEAEALFHGEYAQRSARLIDALNKWRRELPESAATQ